MRVVVVLPTYNERENIAPLVEKLSRVRALMAVELHVLFVDDGSPDGTAGVIEGFMREHDYIHILQRGAKKGLGTAYLDGFRYSLESLDPTVFVQMDSDLQHPPEKVKPLVDAVIGGADVAIGSRYIEGGSFKGLNGRRRMISKGANWLARNVLGLTVHDATTGFKALSRPAVDALLRVKLYSSGFIFQVEELFIFKKDGLRAVEIPFVFEERAGGASKMSSGEIWEYFRSIIAIRFRNYEVATTTKP